MKFSYHLFIVFVALLITTSAVAEKEEIYYALIMEGRKIGHVVYTRSVADMKVERVPKNWARV